MTLPYSLRRAGPFNGTGAPASFPFTFKVFAKTDVSAQLTVNGVTTTLVQDSDYTVTLNADQNATPGGDILYTLAVGATLTLLGSLPYDQPTDLPAGGAYRAQVVEDALDRVVIQTQQLAESADRSLRAPIGEVLAALPNRAARANTIQGYDSDGNPSVAAPLSGSAADVLVQLADKTNANRNAAQVGFNATLNYVAGTLGRAFVDREWSVTDYPFSAKFDGVTDDSAAIQAAINAMNAAGGGRLIFPPRTALHATTLVFKNKIQYVGAGYQATKLTYTGVADQVVIQNPVNSSTVASIHIEGIYFQGLSIAAGKGNLFDTGSSLLTIERCFFYSSAIGLILDQTELFDSTANYYAGAAAGVWIVNGPDRNVGASSFYTNRLSFNGDQFNGGAIAVADDGGVAHAFNDCNFNQGVTHIRACSVRGLTFNGGEFENQSGVGFDFPATRWRSGVAASQSTTVAVRDAFISNGAVAVTMAFAPGTVDNLIFEGNDLDTAAGPVFSGADNVAVVHARGNRQAGAGTGVTGINNYYGPVSGSVAWTAASVNPALGNGTLTSNISRAGRRVTVTAILTIGSTTTLGTGNWLFSLPVASNTIMDIGSAFYVCAGAVYTGVARANTPTGQITLYSASSTANAVQSTVPAAWVNGNSLEFTVTYTATSNLG